MYIVAEWWEGMGWKEKYWQNLGLEKSILDPLFDEVPCCVCLYIYSMYCCIG